MDLGFHCGLREFVAAKIWLLSILEKDETLAQELHLHLQDM